MTPPTVPADLPFGDFERVVATLIAGGGEKLHVNELTRLGATFTLRQALRQTDIRVFRAAVFGGADGQKRLRAVMKLSGLRPLELIIVGGNDDVKTLIAKTKPRYTGKGLGILHLRDDGELENQRASIAKDMLLPREQKLAATPMDAARWNQLVNAAAPAVTAFKTKHDELRQFSVGIKKRRPVATYALMAVIGVVFGLELLLGGPELAPVLVRLGALVPERVAHGEWWRLFSCTFLHGGWAHIAFNVYVLYALGSFMERIIGPARFVVVYVASALGGSLASTLLTDASMSVGASGAVWGLLGAHAVLAYRPRGLLPQAMIAGAKKAALINLALNVANSFRPNVDMWAHFGGGAAGALLVFAGIVTVGLPRLGALEQGAQPDETQNADIPTSTPWRAAAAACALVLLSGPVLAIVMEQPFSLDRAPSLRDTDIVELGVRIPLPANLERAYFSPGVAGQAPPEAVYGELTHDPIVISVVVTPIDAKLAPADVRETLKTKSEAPQSTTAAAPPQTFDANGAPGVCHYYRYKTRIVLDRCFMVWPGQIVRVETIRWEAFPKGAPKGTAKRMLEGATPLNTAAAPVP